MGDEYLIGLKTALCYEVCGQFCCVSEGGNAGLQVPISTFMLLLARSAILPLWDMGLWRGLFLRKFAVT